MIRIKYRLLRENVHVQYYFKRPIFRFNETAVQFLEMIYDALGTRLNIQPSEIGAMQATNLGEARARYSVYGGATSVSLYSDRVAFDFPGLGPSDIPVTHEIMQAVDASFPIRFPAIEPARVEVQEYAHLDVGTQEAVHAILEPYRISTVEHAFGEDLAVINMPIARYSAVSKDGAWRCVVSAEPSQLSSTAIFGTISTVLLKVTPEQTFIEKATRVQLITRRALESLNLEHADAG